jgi:WD40 repeat protein
VLATGGEAQALAFQDGEVLALIQTEHGAQLQRWEITGSKRTQVINLEGGEAVIQAVFSADLRMAAVHGALGPVRIWRLADGINVATTHENVTRAGPLAFSPDGKLLAVGYPDITRDFVNTNRVRVWRIPEASGDLSELVSEAMVPSIGESSAESLVSLAWSPDGQYLAAGYENYRVVVFRTPNLVLFRDLQGSSLPSFITWAPQQGENAYEARLAFGGLEIWQVAPPGGASERLALVNDFLPVIYDMQFSPNGAFLALAGKGRIDIHQTSDGRQKMAIQGMDGAVYSIDYSRDGSLLAAACQDGTTRLYQTSDGLYLTEIGVPTYPLRAVDLSNDGRWLATTGEDALIRVFRMTDGVLMYAVVEPYVSYQLQFSPNTDQLASLTTGGVRLRGITASEESMSMDWESWIGGVSLVEMAYSAGGEFLALAGNDVVRVVEPQSGKNVYSLYDPNGALPWAVSFSPDNAFLAVGWSDGKVRIYWAQDGRQMLEFQAQAQGIKKLTFSRDGRLLASLGEEGVLRIWGVSQ